MGQCLRYAGIYPVYDTSDMEDMDVNKAEALRQGTTDIHRTHPNDQNNDRNSDSRQEDISRPSFTEDSTKGGPTDPSIDGKAHEENRIKPALHHYNPRYDRPYDPLFIFQDISSIGKGGYLNLILTLLHKQTKLLPESNDM